LLPQQLLLEGTCMPENFFEPHIPESQHILRVHTEAYYKDLQELRLDARAIRKIGFPLSDALVKREVIIADGTIKASAFALKHGIAMNIAGGTHHAYSNRGEGIIRLKKKKVI